VVQGREDIAFFERIKKAITNVGLAEFELAGIVGWFIYDSHRKKDGVKPDDQ
jgi:hypothetical protein